MEEVVLFSDGCVGQNKNTFIPTMFKVFLQNSVSVQRVTLYYFVTSHGQSEGDSMHSTIQRSVNKLEECFLPSELETAIRLARQKNGPYDVRMVQQRDIKDWKDVSTKVFGAGVYRVKETDCGEAVKWNEIMAVQVRKEITSKIYIKNSHLQQRFLPVTVGGRRTSGSHLDDPRPAYRHSKAIPKLAKAKYDDLKSLTEGDHPVISRPDHVEFYLNLPHHE